MKARILYCFILVFLFSSCSPGYQVGRSTVTYKFWSTNTGSEEFEVIGADPDTFQQLEFSRYGKDKNYVYYKGKVIPNADPSSFVVLSDYIGKDDKRGYFEHKEIPNSKGKSFRILHSGFSRDDKDVYYFDDPLEVCNIDKFRFLQVETFGSLTWSTDSCTYYMNGLKIPVKDYNSFQILKYGTYGKDKFHVYYGEGILEGADANTFSITTPTGGRDKFRCYEFSFHVSCK